MAALTDPIADFLIRWKNSSRAGKETFRAPHSKIKESIAALLKQEGYIWSFETETTDGRKEIVVKNKFREDGRTPVLTDLKRVSKPGLRKYVGSEEIPYVLNGMGIALVSTSKGVMTGHKAKREKLGGELLATVW